MGIFYYITKHIMVSTNVHSICSLQVTTSPLVINECSLKCEWWQQAGWNALFEILDTALRDFKCLKGP